MGNLTLEIVLIVTSAYWFNPDYALELRNEAFSCDKI